MTRRDMGGLYDRMRDSKQYLESQRDMTRETNGKPQSPAVQAIETVAGSAAIGYAAGRMGTTSFGTSGIPVGLTVGIAGHILSMLGLGGKHSKDLRNVSNGAIAAWAAMWAAGQGSQQRAKSGDATPIVSGAIAGAPVPRSLNAAPSQVSGSPFFAPQRQMGVGGVQMGRPLSEAELQAIQQISRRVSLR